jgi:hypothetical protein
MSKKSLWALFVVIVVGPAPSAVRAQGPGGANPGQGRPAVPPARGPGTEGRMATPPGALFPPPAVQGFRDQEKRRDDQNPWANAHVLHAIPHGLPSSNGPDAGRAAGLHPSAALPERGVPAAEFRFVPTSELRFTPPRVTPVLGEGGSAALRTFSRGKGSGILGGIGAALTAAFGAVFGRKKGS